LRQVSGNGGWRHQGDGSSSIEATHLTHQKPRRPGATRRAGKPWPALRGRPPRRVARYRRPASARGRRPPVAGGRGDDQAGGAAALESAGGEQAVEAGALPGGAGVPAAGAVQHRLDPVAEAGKLLVAPFPGRVPGPDPQAPGGRVDDLDPVVQPLGHRDPGGVGRGPGRGHRQGPGEAAVGAGQGGQAGGALHGQEGQAGHGGDSARPQQGPPRQVGGPRPGPPLAATCQASRGTATRAAPTWTCMALSGPRPVKAPVAWATPAPPRPAPGPRR
jgi:hypothetical protein